MHRLNCHLLTLFTWQRRANFRPNFYHRPMKTGKNKTLEPDQKAAEEAPELFITDEKEVWFVGCHTGAFSILCACGAQIQSAQMSAEVRRRTQIHILSRTFRCAGWYRRSCGRNVVFC